MLPGASFLVRLGANHSEEGLSGIGEGKTYTVTASPYNSSGPISTIASSSPTAACRRLPLEVFDDKKVALSAPAFSPPSLCLLDTAESR
jgi:hypothetical protein